MTDHQITPEQVRKIEEALEERTLGVARRKKEEVVPDDTERREKGDDRRKDID